MHDPSPDPPPSPRGLSSALSAVRRVRRRVESYARQYRYLSAAELVAKLRAELGNAEPALVAALEKGILVAWVSAARAPALDAAIPPSEPPDAIGRAPRAFGGDEPPVRFPAVEAGVKDLLSRRIVTPDEYLELTEDAKGAAYTVARGVSAAAVGAVRDAVARDLISGGGLRDFSRSVGPLLAEAGLAEHQVESLYRTQTGLARAAGMQKVLANPIVGEEFPYCAYDATHDARTRPDHMALERLGIQGTNIYRTDDPVIRRYWAPWAWNCRCLVRLLSIEDAAAAGIFEARLWLRTGVPPEIPARVPDPGFALPKGWPDRSRISPVVS